MLLRDGALELVGFDDAGFDKVQTDPRVVIGAVAEQLQQTRQIQRTERLDDERRRADRAREGSAFGIVACREEDDADASRVGGGFELAAQRVPIARMAFECHVKKKNFGTMAPREREALGGSRCLDHLPALGRERDSRERAERGVVVGNENRGLCAVCELDHQRRLSGLW